MTRVAFAIQRMTPAGGLEIHCLRLAAELVARGCEVTLVTTRPPARLPEPLKLELIAPRGRSNHGRLAAFAADAARATEGRFDVTVAFHAIPGFDVIFCADPSRASPPPIKRWLPRYATFAALERAAFAPGRLDRAMMLSSVQLEGFARNNGAPRERLLLLPPTMDPKRVTRPTVEVRAAARSRRGYAAGQLVCQWIGLQPRTKGLDRVLRALAVTPAAQLMICGLERDSEAAREMLSLADRLGVASRVAWLGFLDDAGLADAIAAADLLVHPSRADVTGMVILEAMSNGLPVITTAICGFEEHVRAADAGVVLGEPFRDADLAAALASAPAQLARWSANARAYTQRDDLFSGLGRAADIILGV